MEEAVGQAVVDVADHYNSMSYGNFCSGFNCHCFSVKKIVLSR